MNTAKKQCTKCQEIKITSAFDRSIKGKLKKNSICKKCRSISEKAKYRERQEVVFMMAGGKCADCGLEHFYPEFFEWHHIDPTTKKFAISSGLKRKLEDLLAEVKKCVMLCANCHKERHLEEDLRLGKIKKQGGV